MSDYDHLRPYGSALYAPPIYSTVTKSVTVDLIRRSFGHGEPIAKGAAERVRSLAER